MVSVIIPVYNGSQYIEKAINSVLTQTSKDFELIIVDDCSTDNTNEILDKFKDNDNVRIIKNNENLGVGLSRKIGINYANGEYVTFLDSDDYLIENFIEVTVKLAKEHDCDIIYTSIGILLPNNNVKVIQAGNYYSENEAKFNIFFWCEMNFLTGKLFKTDLVKRCRWSERRVAEDVQTLFYIMYEASKVMSFPYLGYMHVCREGSLMGYNSDKMDKDEEMSHMFHNFCYNCIAEKEMIEFLIEKKDKILLEPMYNSYFNKIKFARKNIENGFIPHEIFLKYEKLWEIVDNFYPKD